MNEKHIPKIADDTPITQANIDSGRLVLRRRVASSPVEVSWSDEDKGYVATLPVFSLGRNGSGSHSTGA